MIINQGEDPQQAILNVIKEELIKILGSTKKDVNFDNKLTKIMMVGLNGAGKTTTCGKLAYYLNNKLNKKSMLVGLDIYRPAAIEQLKKIADDSKIDFYENGTNNPVDTAKKALDLAEQNNDNAIIFDTAGRIQTNTELMNELVS
jgi:signal recognition particle subunit SRP54